MIAMREPDWEERFWHLTHDLVVGTMSDDTVAMLEPRNTVADCIVAASTAIAMYRAVLQRYPEGFA